jgi:hypothetical protein
VVFSGEIRFNCLYFDEIIGVGLVIKKLFN